MDVVNTSNLCIVPSDVNLREILYSIDSMTREDLSNKYNYFIGRDWYCNTIAYHTLDSIMYHLLTCLKLSGTGIGKGMKFADILIIKATNKVDEDAEKSGNINISFIPSDRVFEIRDDILNGKESDNTIIFDQENSDYIDIDKYTKHVMSKDYCVTISTKSPCMTLVILYVFLENLFSKIISMYIVALEEGDENPLISINFNDLIEVHCTGDSDGKPMISIRPGVMAKLGIKSDDVTEEE